MTPPETLGSTNLEVDLHPEQPVKKFYFEPKKIGFQSTGGVEGLYLPSEQDLTEGTLLTDHGMLPATISPQIVKGFQRSKPFDKKYTFLLKKRSLYVCWLLGEEKPPYYSLNLRTLRKEFPHWIPHSNWFYLQGVIAARSREEVLLKIQRNRYSDVTEEDIQASVSYLKIRNCPGNVRPSQFWQFTATFEEGFLKCQTGERLADARKTKILLKS